MKKQSDSTGVLLARAFMSRIIPPHKPRSYVNSLIRFHHIFTEEERLKAAEKAGWNVFQFPSEMLWGGDLLSDSGTSTMTSEQMAALFLGDEAYGSNWGYFQLLESFEEILGLLHDEWDFFLFHQCRAAEHALYSALRGSGDTVVSNGFFDTTRANAEANGFRALDYPDLHSHERFKGNLDISQLKRVLREKHVSLVITTITNNTGGGQPVSLDNIKEAWDACRAAGVPFFLDACRFAENAWFIAQYEKEEGNRNIRKIVKQIFSLCDGFTISFKKDGLSNMGGMLAIRKDSLMYQRYPALSETLLDHQILTEGHPTYGGISGRDIMTIAEGLRTIVSEAYLEGRVRQVAEFGEMLRGYGVPVLTPYGGHAIYINIDEFFKDTKLVRDDFGGVALTALLLIKGVRLCELGAFAFGVYNPISGKEMFPPHNFVRAAIPRNKYEREDLAYVAECVGALYEQRHLIPAAIPVYGREKTLRHFKARFKLVAK